MSRGREVKRECFTVSTGYMGGRWGERLQHVFCCTDSSKIGGLDLEGRKKW